MPELPEKCDPEGYEGSEAGETTPIRAACNAENPGCLASGKGAEVVAPGSGAATFPV